MTRYFDDIRTARSRALQVYLILIGAAYNRQVLTYKVLSEIVGFGGSGVFARILGHIMFWCDQEGHPPLTSLVVGKKTGLPGSGFVPSKNADSDREKVYEYEWYLIVPPTIEELKTAYDRGMGR